MEGESLHMCKIVKIGPLPDGSYRGLADLDIDLAYDDGEATGEITYKARTGVQISALATSADLGVDNAEMDSLPAPSGFELEGFTTEQVRAGALDAVPYVVYCLNYEDPSMGHFVWSGGTLGEARIKNTALLNFEQRSISNQLKQIIGDVDSTTCRAKFGSQPIGTVGATVTERKPCGFDAESEWVSFTVTVADTTDPDLIFYTDLTAADDYYRPGKVRMLTGANAGIEREIGAYANDGGTVTLSYAFPEPFSADDTGEIRRDCSKHFTGHNSCETFWATEKNLRFRGEPHIPVGDAAMSFTGSSPSSGGTGENTGTEPTYPEPTPTPDAPSNPGSPTARTYGATTVNVDTYGAVGDGVTDDTAAFAAAYAALPAGGGTVTATAGKTYLVDPETSIKPLSNTRLLLPATTTIKASYTATDHKYVIWLDGVSDVQIEGGAVVGYRDSWSAISGTTSEWGHGIYLGGGSSAVTIKDITITKCVGDAISVGRLSSDVWIDNCVLANCRRQGVSTGGDDITITNCDISYISGTSPQAGIDVEVDSPTVNQSLTTLIDGNTIRHCAGPAVQVYKSCDDVTITDNTLEYCSYGILTVDSTTGIATGNAIQHNKYIGAKFTSGSTGWSVGGADTLKNRFFNNNTSLRGTITTGTTATISGTSSGTSDHIKVESSTVTVVTNDFGPT